MDMKHARELLMEETPLPQTSCDSDAPSCTPCAVSVACTTHIPLYDLLVWGTEMPTCDVLS